jgi:hypothetical protein
MSISAMKQALDDICGAKLCEVNSMSSRAEMMRLMDKAISALEQAIAEAEKQEPVAWREVAGKTTHYYDYNEQGRGEPLYAAPVHAIDMSQERVDKMAKNRHDLVYRLRKRAEIRRQIPDRKSVQEGQPDRIADLLEEAAEAFESAKERGWVGLTDDEIWAEGADNEIDVYFAKAIEAKLKEKNA